jgi:hypothetical protein
MIRIPASRATSGMISGIGLAIANTIASLAIVRAISSVSTPAADTQMNTSDPTIASARVPEISSVLVNSRSFSFEISSHSRPEWMIPLESHAMKCSTP